MFPLHMSEYVPETIKLMFSARKTRHGGIYSPYMISTTVELDTLLVKALTQQEPDPFGSPLSSIASSPASSRCSSPEPEDPPPIKTSSLSRPSSSSAQAFVPAQEKRLKLNNGKAVRTKTAHRTAKDKERMKKRRKKKRKEKPSIASCHNEEEIKAYLSQQSTRHFNRAECSSVTVDTETLPTQSTGYQGKVDDHSKHKEDSEGEPVHAAPEMREYTLDELVEDGKNNFQVIKHKPGITQYVTSESDKRAMIIIAPGPKDNPEWDGTCDSAANRIEELRPLCDFSQNPDGIGKQRGPINAINYGISIGNGQQRPMMLSNQGKANLAVAELICETEAFQKIAGFMTVIFLTWAPNLFLYYLRMITLLLPHHRKLHLPFTNSVFTAFALNFGPRTVCFPHRDTKNLAFGWCAITALGKYDHTKGGHLVLWDLKMVIEFPPGTTVFIPSAVLCHLNTAIQDGETRYSFTMFSAGGLFRWVEHGFQLEKVYQNTVNAAREAKHNATRWVRGLSLFSTIDELRQTPQQSI